MRSLIASLCVLVVTLAGAAAPVPRERADAEKVVGKWKLLKSSNAPGGLVVSLEMELFQGGKITLRQSANGGPVTLYEGDYKVVKDQLPYTMKLPGGGEKKETLTIKKLTDVELILVDPDGIQEEFERVKPAKEPVEKK